VVHARVPGDHHLSSKTFPGLEVVCKNFDGSISATCRPEMRKYPRSKMRIPTGRIEVLEGGYIVDLEQFLDANYPHLKDDVKMTNLQAWWTGNGKS
jgi:hypothetical protein